MVIYFVYVYVKKQRYIVNFGKGVMFLLFILVIVFFFILKQLDLGIFVLILLSCGVVLLCVGIRKWYLLFFGIMVGVGIVYFVMMVLYWLRRLILFSDFFQDENGDGYQLINFYFVIDLGGFWGNGLGNSV